MMNKVLCVLAAILVWSSCATYYQANLEFNQEFEKGELRRALATLRKQSSEATGKKRFLYYVNNGLLLSLLGQYEESNDYFEKAYLYGEDYRVNYMEEAGSYLSNPNFTSYRGEDHEHLMLLYYKAINFMKMKKSEEALVECRRLIIRLEQLADRYHSEDTYHRDAFVHALIGIIYDSDHDYNNAFIAFRNALEIYEDEFTKQFGLGAPDQLKKDLLRSAKLSGMTDEYEQYKTQFGMQDFQIDENPDRSELVFFWHNGLSPVKVEWGINLVISRRNNVIIFSNDEMGISFPFDASGYSERDRNNLLDMSVYRVVFPKYVERPLYYVGSTLTVDGEDHALQLMEDVNQIAFKCLQERMNLELSKALLRLAVKKAEEHMMRKQDKTMGSILSIVNAMTEHADTRNWQTLPHSIYYSRVPLKEGMNEVTFTITDTQGKAYPRSFTYEIKKGQTLFHTFSSLETSYPSYGLY
jgi:hypothetical protein